MTINWMINDKLPNHCVIIKIIKIIRICIDKLFVRIRCLVSNSSIRALYETTKKIGIKLSFFSFLLKSFSETKFVDQTCYCCCCCCCLWIENNVWTWSTYLVIHFEQSKFVEWMNEWINERMVYTDLRFHIFSRQKKRQERKWIQIIKLMVKKKRNEKNIKTKNK